MDRISDKQQQKMIKMALLFLKKWGFRLGSNVVIPAKAGI